MGQTIIDSNNHHRRTMFVTEKLIVKIDEHLFQIADKDGQPLIARNPDKKLVDINHWTIPATGQQINAVAKLFAASHGWVVQSNGGTAQKLEFTFSIAPIETLTGGVTAVIRYEMPEGNIRIVDTFGGARELKIPDNLRVFALDIVDLIAGSHNVPYSLYSHDDQATIWRREPR